MAKSAQAKFNSYLDQCRETTITVNEFIEASIENYEGSYAYATGAMSVMMRELIDELPRAKRQYWIDRLQTSTQQQRNELLMKTIKEA
jgi:formaldehyde-activating enzyme involved in methanogenesis